MYIFSGNLIKSLKLYENLIKSSIRKQGVVAAAYQQQLYHPPGVFQYYIHALLFEMALFWKFRIVSTKSAIVLLLLMHILAGAADWVRVHRTAQPDDLNNIMYLNFKCVVIEIKNLFDIHSICAYFVDQVYYLNIVFTKVSWFIPARVNKYNNILNNKLLFYFYDEWWWWHRSEKYCGRVCLWWETAALNMTTTHIQLCDINSIQIYFAYK